MPVGVRPFVRVLDARARNLCTLESRDATDAHQGLALAPTLALALALTLSLSLSRDYVSFATASPIRLSPSRIISFDAAYEIRTKPGAPNAVPGTTAQRASSKR